MRAWVLVMLAGCGGNDRPAPPATPVTTDPGPPRDRLEWQLDGRDHVPWDAARARCAAKSGGWRLPTRRELASLLVDPAAESPALRPDAPAMPREQGVWGEDIVGVSRPGAPALAWHMRLDPDGFARFTELGRTGFVLCTRGALPGAPPPAPPAVVTFGPADAKLTVVVAPADHHFAKRARRQREHLLATYPVRFEIRLHEYVPGFRPMLLALCAAARANVLPAFEQQWIDAPEVRVDEPDELRALAIAAGVPADAYDRAATGECAAAIDADTRHIQSLGELEGTPTFWVGTQRMHGLEGELFSGESELERAIRDTLAL